MTVNRGFTLVEILIVIVIIGITVGFALIAFGDFGESKRVMFFAEQLVNNLRLSQQQAILETSTYGLRIDNKGYQILKFSPPASWSTVPNKAIFKINFAPKNTILTLKTQSYQAQGAPVIIINSSGDLSPFTLNLGTNMEHSIATIAGSQNGEITITTAKTA